MRLNNGSTTAVLDYGPGGYADRPQINRYMQIYNNTGADMFVPDNSTAEKNSTYNGVPGAVYRGHWASGGQMFYYQGMYGNGICWSGGMGGSYNAAPGCPGGWTLKVNSNAFGQPNRFYGANAPSLDGYGNYTSDGILYGFYQTTGWGCPSGYNMGVNVTVCYR